jgi:hypothetical protein
MIASVLKPRCPPRGFLYCGSARQPARPRQGGGEPPGRELLKGALAATTSALLTQEILS